MRAAARNIAAGRKPSGVERVIAEDHRNTPPVAGGCGPFWFADRPRTACRYSHLGGSRHPSQASDCGQRNLVAVLMTKSPRAMLDVIWRQTRVMIYQAMIDSGHVESPCYPTISGQ